MHSEAARVFHAYQLELEHEPGLLGMRLCLGENGGLVWRNKAQREFYDPKGYFASPTLPWSGVASYFTPPDLSRLKQAYRDVFKTDDVIERCTSFGPPGNKHHAWIEFMTLFGTIHAGVVLARSRPCVECPWRQGCGRL